jgi:hypothetical protein
MTYTQEVRDLFHLSIIADVVPPDELEDGCAFVSDSQERCTCTPVSRYYLGRRAVPGDGIEGVNRTGYCESLAQLEDQCRCRIDQFRRDAYAARSSERNERPGV